MSKASGCPYRRRSRRTVALHILLLALLIGSAAGRSPAGRPLARRVSNPRNRADLSKFVPGGLVEFPAGTIGPNLAVNPGFEDAGNKQSPGWSASGGWGYAFNPDCTVAHSGACSARYTEKGGLAWQAVPLKAGVYQLSGWVKTQDLAQTKGSGARLCLSYLAAGVCTPLVKGSSDWQQLAYTRIVIPSALTATVKLETYGAPDGTAWFDDIRLEEEQFPLSVFLLYPNYRGLLYDDQSQVVRLNVAVDPPAGTTVDDYQVNGTVTDETTGAAVLEVSFPAAVSKAAELDFSRLQGDRTYKVAFRLVPVTAPAGGSPGGYDYPAYRILKVSGALRASMTMSVDAQNRFLANGTPTFLLGVYDAGMGWFNYESGWENLWNTQRRLFELPINFYLNYWYGQTPNEGWLPMMNVLKSHGIYTITNANCGAEKTIEGYYGPGNYYWFVAADDAAVRERSAHPGFAGFYSADECNSYVASNVFGHYQRMKALNPGGITLGTLLGDPGLPLWRDAVDVLATDPYPMYGREPATGYPLSQVADWTRAAVSAVQGSRPVISVLQFFKFTTLGRWPTQSELRNMSYMAIAEGANGLLYWSLGTNALAYICDGSTPYYSPAGSASWCQAKVDNFGILKNVLTELDGLREPLSAVDRPALLASREPAAIRVRVKSLDKTAYLVASNSTNTKQHARFTWAEPVAKVSVYGEPVRQLSAIDSTFEDDFEPYSAQVYIIEAPD